MLIICSSSGSNSGVKGHSKSGLRLHYLITSNMVTYSEEIQFSFQLSNWRVKCKFAQCIKRRSLHVLLYFAVICKFWPKHKIPYIDSNQFICFYVFDMCVCTVHSVHFQVYVQYKLTFFLKIYICIYISPNKYAAIVPAFLTFCYTALIAKINFEIIHCVYSVLCHHKVQQHYTCIYLSNFVCVWVCFHFKISFLIWN